MKKDDSDSEGNELLDVVILRLFVFTETHYSEY
jgi:hypothetical protein